MKKMLTMCLVMAGVAYFTACSNTSRSSGTNNEADLYKTWRLVEVNGETIDTTGIPKPLEFTFEQADSQFSGSAGCNRIFGKFTLTAPDNISFPGLAATRMACPDMSVEQKFLEASNKVNKWAIRQGMLVLSQNENALLRFKAK
ncbi:META domain-containing protein [Chitinophaga sp. GCM10012297]|uniref:META domain-containing protein n=1 Tax=Chitinophaga chungangae TaxID=2821488 RepID=A0ABS3YHM1_9BACT|nr:META domain-containing protein [Chitinophaga chungangae]MBO9154181.1 META domain-containing protein [Chitinophaga chungangae]